MTWFGGYEHIGLTTADCVILMSRCEEEMKGGEEDAYGGDEVMVARTHARTNARTHERTNARTHERTHTPVSMHIEYLVSTASSTSSTSITHFHMRMFINSLYISPFSMSSTFYSTASLPAQPPAFSHETPVYDIPPRRGPGRVPGHAPHPLACGQDLRPARMGRHLRA